MVSTFSARWWWWSWWWSSFFCGWSESMDECEVGYMPYYHCSFTKNSIVLKSTITYLLDSFQYSSWTDIHTSAKWSLHTLGQTGRYPEKKNGRANSFVLSVWTCLFLKSSSSFFFLPNHLPPTSPFGWYVFLKKSYHITTSKINSYDMSRIMIIVLTW